MTSQRMTTRISSADKPIIGKRRATVVCRYSEVKKNGNRSIQLFVFRVCDSSACRDRRAGFCQCPRDVQRKTESAAKILQEQAQSEKRQVKRTGGRDSLPPLCKGWCISMEIWKDIPGYEGKYQASTEGRIRSVDRLVRAKCHYTGKDFYRRMTGRVLKPGQYCGNGHVSVVLGHGTAGRPVHQLIMITFAGLPPKGLEVLHINGNPKDNRLSNLRYGTRTENILDVYRQGGVWRKLSAEDVGSIRFGLSCGMKGSELAAMFGVSQNTISKIKNGGSFAWLK